MKNITHFPIKVRNRIIISQLQPITILKVLANVMRKKKIKKKNFLILLIHVREKLASLHFANIRQNNHFHSNNKKSKVLRNIPYKKNKYSTYDSRKIAGQILENKMKRYIEIYEIKNSKMTNKSKTGLYEKIRLITKILYD